MPALEFATEDFQSRTSTIARTKVSNFYLVDNPVSLSGVSYIPRPSVGSEYSLPAGPNRGIWSQKIGEVNTLYSVVGTSLYKIVNSVTSLLGTVAGSNRASFASNLFHVAVTAGGHLYLWNGVALVDVPIPDAGLVTNVTSFDNYFFVGIKGTTKFYYLEPGATVINPLNFLSAERSPDDVISLTVLGDELWVLGQKTCEVFVSTGDAAAPFVRVAGRTYTVGCFHTDTVVLGSINNRQCVLWVTPSKEVIFAQGDTVKISNESIEELLKSEPSLVGWFFRTNRHDFYVLSGVQSTLVYDLTKGRWYRWSSYEKNTWDAVFGVQNDDSVYVSVVDRSSIFQLGSASTDETSGPIICEVSGLVQNRARTPMSCTNVNLFLNYGNVSSYSKTPIVEMRWSDDQGNTWSDYVQGSAGNKGDYTTTILFRSLGLIWAPGRMFEVRFSEDQIFRFDGATYNER